MRVRKRNRDAFPQLTSFLKSGIGGAFDDSDVVAAFIRFSDLNEQAARKAVLEFSTAPWVDIQELGLGRLGGEASGRFDPELPGRILVDLDVAQRFEQDHGLPTARRFVQATVLHELVHWGDWRDDETFRPGEAGEDFERDAYGAVQRRWWTELRLEPRLLFPVEGRIGGGSHHWGRSIRSGDRSHHGIDVFNDVGTPIFAAADGEVLGGNRFRKGGVRLSEVGNYGQMVDVLHGDGIVTRYAHLGTVEVTPGAVQAGARIGTLGATGTEWGRWLFDGSPPPGPPDAATRPHLHFEALHSRGQPFGDFDATFDPASFFDWIPSGAGARNVSVTALRPGLPLREGESRSTPDPTTDLSDVSRGAGAAFPNREAGPDSPRGLRNNNPGNIKRTGDAWLGLLPPELQMDPTFFQFAEMRFGIRAMARILRRYAERGIATLRELGATWAPSVDGNDSVRYAENVLAHSLGIAAGIDARIELTDGATLFGVIRGIVAAENGGLQGATISDDVVAEGIELEQLA